MFFPWNPSPSIHSQNSLICFALLWITKRCPKNHTKPLLNRNAVLSLLQNRMFKRNIWNQKCSAATENLANLLYFTYKLYYYYNFVLICGLFHCKIAASSFSDPDLRGSGHLCQGPQVCEFCQAGNRRSLSHELGRDGERSRRPDCPRGRPVAFSLWGPAGRRNELRDFVLNRTDVRGMRWKKHLKERERASHCLCPKVDLFVWCLPRTNGKAASHVWHIAN